MTLCAGRPRPRRGRARKPLPLGQAAASSSRWARHLAASRGVALPRMFHSPYTGTWARTARTPRPADRSPAPDMPDPDGQVPAITLPPPYRSMTRSAASSWEVKMAASHQQSTSSLSAQLAAPSSSGHPATGSSAADQRSSSTAPPPAPATHQVPGRRGGPAPGGCSAVNAVPYLLLPHLLADSLSKVLVAPQLVEQRAHDPCGVYLSRERELLEESMLLPIQIEREANGLRRPGWWSAPTSWLARWLAGRLWRWLGNGRCGYCGRL